MSNKYSRDSSKMKKLDNYKKNRVHSAGAALQYYVAQDVKLKNSRLKGYGSTIDKDKGIKWFNEGLTLEDAPEELRNNISFVNGFNYAYRIKLVNDTLYKTGIEYFERGISLIDVPEKYINNPYFMDGYNSCKGRNK